MSAGGELGRYRLVRRLAAGGMGEVYLGAARGPGGVERQVAIKVVRELGEQTAALREMFYEEAKLSFVLSHPNVVQTLDVGEVDGQHFLVLEYVDGVTLARLAARTEVPQALVLHVGAQVARGLAYAHGLRDEGGAPMGVVHRDISPSNVLVSRGGHVKIADFGLATSTLRDTRSEAGVVKGKLGYMPPEQVRGGELEARSDVYSLGVVLYELLGGRHPFGDPRGITYAARAAGVEVAPLGVDDGVASELSAVVQRCLAEEPRWRPSADELRRELETQLAEHGPIDAEPQLGELVQQAAAAAAKRSPFDRALDIELRRVEGAESTFVASSTLPPADGETAGDAGDGGDGDGGDSVTSLGSSPTLALGQTQPQVQTPRDLHPPVNGRMGTTAKLILALLVVGLVGGGVLLARALSSGGGGDRAGSGSVVAGSGGSVAGSGGAAAADTSAARTGTGSAQSSGGRSLAGSGSALPAGSSAKATLALRPVPGGGRVWVDGKLRGTAPVTLSGLAPGSVAVRVVTPGRRDYRATVTLSPGQTLTLEPRLARRHRVRVRPRRLATGTLSVNSEPWSIVYVDGRRVRGTPLLRHRLAVGRHRVRLVHPPKKLRAVRFVRIRAGKETKLVVTLRR